MSNQPPPRPWFRLATLARPQAPAQTQPPAAPVPRAPTFRSVFRPIALAPQPPPASSAPSSQPQSPSPRAAILPPSPRSPPPRSPPTSPAPSQTQPQSPVPREATVLPPSASPRSPLAIPDPPPPKATPPVTASLFKTPPKSPSPPTPSPDASPPSQKSSSAFTKSIEHNRALNNDGNGINPAYSLNIPPHSPNLKPNTTVSPPSPYALPPSLFNSSNELKNNYIQPEAEKKTVLVQETLPKLKPKPKGRESSQWKSSDEEEVGMRFITITGENRGAVMELGYSPTKGRRTINEGKEARSKMEEEAKGKGGLPVNAYMNSNVQGVNSSILFNSSCTHHDPGLHFSLSRKPFNNGAHPNVKNIPQTEKGTEKWFSA